MFNTAKLTSSLSSQGPAIILIDQNDENGMNKSCLSIQNRIILCTYDGKLRAECALCRVCVIQCTLGMFLQVKNQWDNEDDKDNKYSFEGT